MGRAAYGHRDDLAYFCGDGLDIVDAYEAAMDAVEHVRSTRRPGFLHLKLVRLLGHAGSDVQQSYHKLETIEAAEALDPVFLTAKLLVEQGRATPQQLIRRIQLENSNPSAWTGGCQSSKNSDGRGSH